MVKIYKLILTSVCFVLIATNLYAQTNVAPGAPATAQRYKQEFEIKGIAHPDNVLLSKINISKFDYLRQTDKRVEAKDADNSLILILYSENEIAKMKEALVRQASSSKTVTDVKSISTPKIAR